MSNIYLKVTIEAFSKLRFSGFKKLPPGQLLGSSNSQRFYWTLNLFASTWKSDVSEQTVCDFSFLLVLKGVMNF